MYNLATMKKPAVSAIIVLLSNQYGKRTWKITPDPVAVLVQTILSQNTSDTNSDKAFASLTTTFHTWERLASAPIPAIADSIRNGGLAEVKSRYIQQALHHIREKRGEIKLDFLKQLTMENARKWLTALPGVGTKTANCVLLFSLGMPALPVDTHVFRVAKRLGLASAASTIEQVQIKLEKMVPKDDVYSFHVLLIEHGRKTCKAQRPLCKVCGLKDICPSNIQ